MKIDMDAITMGELEQLQQIVKKPVSKAFQDMDAVTMRALWFLFARRDDPDYTWEATEEVTFAQFNAALVDDADPFGREHLDMVAALIVHAHIQPVEVAGMPLGLVRAVIGLLLEKIM